MRRRQPTARDGRTEHGPLIAVTFRFPQTFIYSIHREATFRGLSSQQVLWERAGIEDGMPHVPRAYVRIADQVERSESARMRAEERKRKGIDWEDPAGIVKARWGRHFNTGSS